jgi:uncharacterized protein (TIGR03086 family)
MTMSDAPGEQAGGLARALEATGELVAGVADGQWDSPTPCADWTVRDLVAHLVSGNQATTQVLRGETPLPPGGGPSGSELQRSWPQAASDLVAAFGAPGVLAKTFTVPFGTVPGPVALNLRLTETLVHGWDLARATGQHASFPADLIDGALAFSRGALSGVPPARSPVGPPQPVPDGAPAIDQLAGLLGRTV